MDIHELQEHRGWVLAWGCISILAGLAAMTYSVIATLVSVIFLGWILIFAGVVEFAYAIRHRERGHLLLYILQAVLGVVVGGLLLRSPVTGAVVLTMLVAAYFVVSGIFRLVAAFALRLPHWGWVVTSGIINLGLGMIVWAGWPVTGLWVIGLFLGINLLFRGWTQVMLAVALRPHRLEPLTT
jgi:uncharacterized membrane protein HdeD (DUF308 family)